ncbi:hypothetical protein EJD97_003578, partial [Solanum chilense]
SMRNIRGMSLHVNFVDNLPSFSMGLTRIFGVNVGSMAKSKQVQDEQAMEVLRSKKKNELMAVQKVIDNVIVSGIKIVEGGTKRKAITSDSEDSEFEIHRTEEHQDREIVA